jgi:hypothetical protein
MAAFSELWPFGGVGPWGGSVFMMLPTGGANLVILEGASLRHLDYDRNKFNLTVVTNENQLKVGKGLHAEVAAHLKGALGGLKKDAQLLIVRKSRGTEDNVTVGKGGSVKLQVGMCPPRRYKLAFKFMQHDTSTRPSKWKPEHAKGWVEKLNAIYGAQANIMFEMAETPDYFTVPTALGQPITNKAFEAHIVGHKSKVTTEKGKPPVLTVFLVGKWKDDGDHPNGTFFFEHDVAVLTDEPTHSNPDIGTEPLVLTLAHEVAHFILQHRGFRNQSHHHSRAGILHSTASQSARFDKQLINNLNPY